MSSTYTDPVAKLLRYGECRNFKKWPDYLELGLTREHIPELIRIATDEELNWADSDSLEVWAPVHAWRALGQLHAEEAIGPLIRLFHELEDSDWAGEELPIIYEMIGPRAIPTLAQYLAEDSHGTFPRVTAAHSLERIGNSYPEAKEPCLLVLKEQLERFQENDPTVNGFLISYLINLQAVELLPLVKQVFAAERVDLMIAGDLEDVEIAFGVRASRSHPRPLSPLQKQLQPLLDQFATQHRTQDRKIGRNDPCPCGSGKKYKKCCLNKPSSF